MFRHAKRQTYGVLRITAVLVLTTMIALLAWLTVLPLRRANAASTESAQKAVTVLPINANDILKAHNTYRTEVGDPPLQWSNTVAQSALSWAETMASTYHNCVHSGAHQESGHGENCAGGSAGYFSPTQLIDIQWGAEKKNFIPGCTFKGLTRNDPCSKTGNWLDIGHYTQIVWRKTTEVGCGFVRDSVSNYDFLVCQYNPPGNIIGEKVY